MAALGRGPGGPEPVHPGSCCTARSRAGLAARKDRSLIEQREQQIAARDQQKAKAEEILNLPANRGTRDRAQFLNELFLRKAFSWTKVFEDLERVMPRPAARGFHPAGKGFRQSAGDQAGGGGRIARPRPRAGAQDGKLATLPANSNRAGIKPGADRRPATTCNSTSAAVYVPDLDRFRKHWGKEHAMMPDSRDVRQKVKIAIAALLVVDIDRRGCAVFSAGGIGAVSPRTTGPVVAGVAAQDPRGRAPHATWTRRS